MDLSGEEIKFNSQQVEIWLDENRSWTHEYFQRKITVDFVLTWIKLNENICKTNGIYYSKRSESSFDDLQNNHSSKNKNNSTSGSDAFEDVSCSDDEIQEDEDAVLLQYTTKVSRRFSEPASNYGKDLKNRLHLQKNHTLQNKLHETIPEDDKKDAVFSPKYSSTSHLPSRRSNDVSCKSLVKQRHRSMAQLGSLIESRIKLPNTKSLDQGKKLNLKHNNEDDFFYEIIKDMANNLNLTALSYNILVNIGILTNADRCSLFLVDGPKNSPTLVSELFDVHPIRLRSTSDKSGFVIRVPWGKGIVGYAAETGQTVNIQDAYADSRFNKEVDKQTGYRTRSLLCIPIKNSDGEVVGVAQLINKNPDASTFTKEDQELCNRYLPFCGIAITNAKLFELSQKEFQRNKFLIEMIHDIFEEQTSIGKVVNRIMKRSLKLMKCEHCSVLLLNEPLLDSGDDQLVDRNHENLKFSNSYHLKMASTGRHSVIASEINGDLFKALTVLSERVVANPKTLCISDINEDADLKILAGRSCDEIKSILSMPIRNSKSEILGVASLMNKVNNCPFDGNDMSFFEAIVLFCGLGINNTMLYDQMAKAKAKQQVALEVLSYHVKCPQVEVERLKLSAIPSVASIDLGSMRFDDFSLDPDQMLTASVRMFLDCGLIEDFNIDYQTLCLWLTTTRKNYRNVIYHNWRHAFNVAQSMFAILTTGNMMQHLSKLECFALLAGCLCHDVDHRGTNNAFQEKTASPLATLYGTSVMEHHHFNHTIMILNTEGHNIFQNLSPSSYRKVISLLRHSILSTDLAINMKYRGTFFPLVENGELDLEDDNHRSMLRAMLMTTCDLCGITKPWKIQREVVNLVASEFIQQGDIEREKFHENNIPAMMDRQKKNELPRMQVQFFDNVGIPLFRICEKVNPLLKPLLDGAIANRNQWEQLQSSSLSAET